MTEFLLLLTAAAAAGLVAGVVLTMFVVRQVLRSKCTQKEGGQ